MLHKTLGILGGGQLGKMMLQQAADFNLTTMVLDPADDAPCRHLCHTFVQGSFQDFHTVLQFGQPCDIITIEIESVNVEALFALEKQGKHVFPQPHIIEMIQDKGKQKMFFTAHEIPTASYELVNDIQEIKRPFPFIQKLRHGGYDGKGVRKIDDAAELSVHGFTAPCVVEEFINFEKEIAVIGARNADGEVVIYPCVEMKFNHEANLLDYLFAPAAITPAQEKEAQAIVHNILEKLQLVGLLAVEMFVTPDGKISVNEMAPRTHNSGHQSIEANITSQYEQLIRAIYNMPLGSTAMIAPSVMFNLLGEKGCEGVAKYEGVEHILDVPGAHLHLYGKQHTKPFRKMGHVTIINASLDTAINLAMRMKEAIKVVA